MVGSYLDLVRSDLLQQAFPSFALIRSVFFRFGFIPSEMVTLRELGLQFEDFLLFLHEARDDTGKVLSQGNWVNLARICTNMIRLTSLSPALSVGDFGVYTRLCHDVSRRDSVERNSQRLQSRQRGQREVLAEC